TFLATLLTLTAQAAIQLPAPAPMATIRGVVVKFGTMEPVALAGVELSDEKGFGVQGKAVEAGTDGKFVIANVAPGTNRIAATHFGYVRSEYGQRGADGKGLTITIAAGQELSDLRIGLVETGVISGRVLDTMGKAIPDVQVLPLRYEYRNGRRLLTPVRAVL